jgi:phosphoglycerate dehydrogenase-like enzyme
MPRVLCLRPEGDFTRIGVTPPGNLDIVYMAPDDEELSSALAQAKALVIPAVGPKLPLALFEGSDVRLVQVTGAGVDRVDVAGLAGLGIAVANVPGGSNDAIAEYALSCASVLLRRHCEASAEIRAGRYQDFRKQLMAGPVDGLVGLCAGIVGLGTIGRAVARKFHDAGCRICYFDPALSDPDVATALDAEALGLQNLVSRCDIVTVHVPLLPATVDLIDGDVLKAAKPGSVLIQASRGGVVNEAALAEALESGRLAGAAVDVYASEPPEPDNPLLNLSDTAAARTILTPHIAGITRQSWVHLFQAAWDNVVRTVVDGADPEHAVTA